MSVSRRTFLKQAALGAAALPLVGPWSGWTPRRTRALHAVIVGSGLAGLAAAYTFRRAGWRVTVLDGRDRLGGRVLSHRFASAPHLVCELGAEWIGESHERMQALCRDFGLELKDHRFEHGLIEAGRYHAADEWGFSAEADTGWERLRHEFEAAAHALEAGDETAARALDRADWWTTLRAYGFSDDDLRRRDLMDSTDFGESIRHVSAWTAAAEYFESSEENEMDFKVVGGNSLLVEALADRVGRDAFRLRRTVRSVRDHARGVTVEADGPDGPESVEADVCVCAIPARALDAVAFDPPLPEAQRAAARSLQYARIVKNHVLYSERFWPHERFAAVTDGLAHYVFHSTSGQPGDGGILCSYSVGEKADVVAAQTPEQRRVAVARDLGPWTETARSVARDGATYAWQRDRFTQGAYALYRPGQWFDVRPVLAEPHGRIQFAGEHIADWQGFMEGAVNTGEDAAQAFLD